MPSTTFPSVDVNYTVLSGAIAVESWALKAALANMRGQIRRYGWSGLHKGVVRVDSVRTVFFGPNRLPLTADVSFDPALDTGDTEADIDAIEASLREADDRAKTVYGEPEL